MDDRLSEHEFEVCPFYEYDCTCKALEINEGRTHVPSGKHIEEFCKRSFMQCNIFNMVDFPDESDMQFPWKI